MNAFGFDLRHVDELPPQIQQRAASVYLDYQREQLRTAEQLDADLSRIAREFQHKLEELIGQEHLAEYRRRHQESGQKLRRAVKTTRASEEDRRKLAQLRGALVSESKAFLDATGFDAAAAGRLRQDYLAQVRATRAKRFSQPGETTWVVLPEEVPDNVHNPWAVFRPPYPGWAWSYEWRKSGGPRTPTLSHHLDSLTGEVGSNSEIVVVDADNSDFVDLRYRTGVWIWYRMPVTGLVEAWLEMQCIESYYSGHHYDEFGFSDVDTGQDSAATLQVISPPGYVRRSNILSYRETQTGTTWHDRVAEAGDFRWAHLFSADAYVEGTWLLLEAGTEEWNHFESNDVTVRSTLAFNWWLKTIYVRSTGE